MRVFYHFFIGRFKNQAEEYSKAKLILNFSIAEAFVSIFYAFVHSYLGFHIPQWLFIGFTILQVCTVFFFKSPVGLFAMAHVMISVMWFTFILGMAYSGGIYSLVLPWMALMPIIANYLIDRKAAKIWLVISGSSVVFFMFAFKNQEVMLDQSGDWRSLVAHLGLVVVAFLFSDLFSSAKAKLVSDLKLANVHLQEQKEEVVTQNEELTSQRDEIAGQRNHIEKQNSMLVQQNQLVEKVNEELAKRVREIFERNGTLNKHWHTLLEISKSRSINFGDFEEALKHIAKTTADSLKTDRVSVWQFQSHHNAIKCLMLYETDGEKFTHEEVLLAKDFANYFEALREEEVIAADDAEKDFHTFEFKDSYLKPRHIESMLDTPYFLDGKLGGVICCEHQTHRHWLPEDIIFVQALSDIVSLVFRAAQRRGYEAKIRSQKKEIVRANQGLEEKILERTKELEIQNTQLTEYAFINSHLLRGPLSRILGLVNLIEKSNKETKEEELIAHLKLSANELDDVVKRINSAIDNGNHFGRDHFDNNTSFTTS